MKRIYPHIIYACLLACLITGCKTDYPHIEYEGLPGEVVFEHIESQVPIYVAINDPLYESNTRGMGIFDNLKEGDTGNSYWKDADIYVYAFYAPNGLVDAPNDLNYSERMNSKDEEKIFCLVDDSDDENIGHGKRARINRDMASFLQWSGNTMVYYNSIYQQYRYKFFAYHIDDAADLTRKPERRRDYVAYDVKIDGTQDLMCGYAAPTAKQLATLTATGDKHIINKIDKLAYSTATGHLDLFPIFQMRHQLTSLRFFLKTDSIVNAEGIKEIDPSAQDVRVNNIFITTPYHGEFVVAADDTSKLGLTFTDETRKIYMPVKVKVDEADSIVTDEYNRRITVSRAAEGKVMPGDSVGFNPSIIPAAEEKEVGVGFLVPPSDRYTIHLVYSQITTDSNGNQEEPVYYRSQYEIKFDGGKTFKAGHKYEVCIKVYGQRHIDLDFNNTIWKDGGDIDIGNEEEDFL